MRIINQSVIDKPLILNDEILVISNPDGDIIIDAEVKISNCKSVTLIAKNIYQNVGAKITIDNSTVQFLATEAFHVAGDIDLLRCKIVGEKVISGGPAYHGTDFKVVDSTFITTNLRQHFYAAKKDVLGNMMWFHKNKALRHVECHEHHQLVDDNCKTFTPDLVRKNSIELGTLREKIFRMIKPKDKETAPAQSAVNDQTQNPAPQATSSGLKV